MNFDGLPSSPAFHSPLPSSSAPAPTNSTGFNGKKTPIRDASRQANENGAHVNGNQNGTDALALDDVQQGASMEVEGAPGRRRRGRARGAIDENVPLVRDALGEQITETFQIFLDT